jgi:anti-sigma factor RsiW
MSAAPSDTEHIDAETLGLYLDAALGLEERQRVVRHLASCRECRQQLLTAHRGGSSLPEVKAPEELVEQARSLVEPSVPSPGPRRTAPRRRTAWAGAAAAVLAAVLGLVFFLPGSFEPPPDLQTPSDPETLRSGRHPGDPQSLEPRSLEPLAPIAGQAVDGSRVVLSWAPAEDDPEAVRRYELTITDGTGSILFETSTSEPRAEVTAESLGPPGERFWSVVAVLEDGRRLESPVARFNWQG